MAVVNVDLKKKVDYSYQIHIGRGLLGKLGEYIPLGKRKTGIITDANVADLYGNELAKKHGLDIFPFPEGERSKNLENNYLRLVRELLEGGYNRDGQVITLGGGVPGDMGGFVAATVNRGIPYYQVATTLLAAVDSSVGGKTAVDFAQFKNKVGSFYQPKAVIIDLDTFVTLKPREMINGLAEVIKYGIIMDRDLFESLEKNIHRITDPKKPDFDYLEEIVQRCCYLKAHVVHEDEKEAGYRSILNFGHTFGHAIEGLLEYELGHGYCISIGMVIADDMAVKKGILKASERDRHVALLSSVGLTVRIPKRPNLTINEMIRLANEGDKKAEGGRAKFVLVEETGKIHLSDGKYTGYVEEEIVREALAENMEN